jgi:hypothetical protein
LFLFFMAEYRQVMSAFPLQEHFLKLSIIARVCHPERDAAKVGFVDRPGSFPYCDIVNPALLPKIMASAPLMSAASLERMRQDFASGTSRLESSSDSALGTLAFQRDNSRILINELPEQFAQYSKPTAALLADITSSGRTWWFCCAEEWRRAGPKTSLDGHGDLIFIGINAEFLFKLQACAARLALQEPITPPSTPLPHAPPQLSFRNAGTFSGLLPDSATAEGTTGAATQGRDGRTGSLGGGSMTDEANMAGSEEGIVVLDEASAARPSSAGSASSAVDGTGRSVVEHRAMLNRLSINSNLAGGGPGIGLKTALTTWSFFPLPMTPVHASVVEELAVAMAGLLPIQEVVGGSFFCLCVRMQRGIRVSESSAHVVPVCARKLGPQTISLSRALPCTLGKQVPELPCEACDRYPKAPKAPRKARFSGG